MVVCRGNVEAVVFGSQHRNPSGRCINTCFQQCLSSPCHHGMGSATSLRSLGVWCSGSPHAPGGLADSVVGRAGGQTQRFHLAAKRVCGRMPTGSVLEGGRWLWPLVWGRRKINVFHSDIRSFHVSSRYRYWTLFLKVHPEKFCCRWPFVGFRFSHEFEHRFSFDGHLKQV